MLHTLDSSSDETQPHYEINWYLPDDQLNNKYNFTNGINQNTLVIQVSFVAQKVSPFYIFLKVARAGLGSKPGIFWFRLFSHSITLQLSHSSPHHFKFIVLAREVGIIFSSVR
jgi:hypothetical protein